MLDSSLSQTSSDSPPVARATTSDATAMWGGFFAGLFNWYILAKTIMIYRSELWLSVAGSSCGTCAAYGDQQVYLVAPMWIGVGFILWLRVRTVAPPWVSFAKWPIRFALLGWISVVLAAFGATFLSRTPPFLHRM